MTTYTVNRYGLRDKDMKYMEELFLGEPTIDKVILYGSRARGDFERGSDVDLAIFGEYITPSVISNLHFKLENESPTLLFFDMFHFEKVTNRSLKENILKEGREIYSKR